MVSFTNSRKRRIAVSLPGAWYWPFVNSFSMYRTTSQLMELKVPNMTVTRTTWSLWRRLLCSLVHCGAHEPHADAVPALSRAFAA
eukprot:3385992-Lingulodinium_polyedra.AAC.1